jgi:hypothetical protein
MADIPNTTNASDFPADSNPLADPSCLEARRAFERAKTRWLKARATRDDPDGPEDDEFSVKVNLEYDQAEREMILTPASQDWMVWDKIELFERALTDEMRNGGTGCFLMVALGAIKADLIRLGIGSELPALKSGRLQ